MERNKNVEKRLPGAMSLKKPGCMEDPEEYKQVLNLTIKELDIKDPVKVMFAGRMVKIWQRINYIEDTIQNQGLYFSRINDRGELTGVQVNQLAYLLKQLESEFRSYYRMLNQKWNQDKKESADSFLQMIENAKKVNKTKPKGKVIKKAKV